MVESSYCLLLQVYNDVLFVFMWSVVLFVFMVSVYFIYVLTYFVLFQFHCLLLLSPALILSLLLYSTDVGVDTGTNDLFLEMVIYKLTVFINVTQLVLYFFIKIRVVFHFCNILIPVLDFQVMSLY